VLQPGAVLSGRYRLGAMIGRGGMAEVYRAWDDVLERSVAVKAFRRDTTVRDEDARQRTEVQMLAGLRHQNLVTVYDAGTETSVAADPRSYLVLELIDGQTLAQHVADGPVPGAEAAAIGRQLASALAYVHSQGIVHRDVKPANILLDRVDDSEDTVNAKLTDFGVARFLESTRMTSVGLTVGTANYLSPEQALGQDVTPASDVYSLGLVLLECLTGIRAFPGYGVEAAVARLHRDPDVPRTLGPAWGSLLVGMTARDPNRRPGASDVARVLREMTPAEARVVIEGADATTDSIGPLPGFHWLPPVAARSVSRSHPRGRGGRRRSVPVAVGLAGAAGLATLVIALAGFGAAPVSDTATDPSLAPAAGVVGSTVSKDIGARIQSARAAHSPAGPVAISTRHPVRPRPNASTARTTSAPTAARTPAPSARVHAPAGTPKHKGHGHRNGKRHKPPRR
jgi:tRNA A-37 threonylcarbamoyl transferase component Bud32